MKRRFCHVGETSCSGALIRWNPTVDPELSAASYIWLGGGIWAALPGRADSAGIRQSLYL